MRFTISDISTALVFLSPEPKKRDNNTHRNEQSGRVMMTEMKSTSLQLQLSYYKKNLFRNPLCCYSFRTC